LDAINHPSDTWRRKAAEPYLGIVWFPGTSAHQLNNNITGFAMQSQLFVNLAVSDVARSRAFFQALGFSFNAQFSNELAACVVLNEHCSAMLLARDFFQTFTDKSIMDSGKATEVLLCLSCTTRNEVDALVSKAIEAGGRAHRQAQDRGFMYGHGFEDLDGHIWELMCMDPPVGSK
jgi:predicted lactoylglutathione lyase